MNKDPYLEILDSNGPYAVDPDTLVTVKRGLFSDVKEMELCRKRLFTVICKILYIDYLCDLLAKLLRGGKKF